VRRFAPGQDIGAKAISYAEKNLQSSLDFAQALKAKDLTEMMRPHSEFIQAQMRSPAEQASKTGQDVSRAEMEKLRYFNVLP
jgi:hypothetical protein